MLFKLYNKIFGSKALITLTYLLLTSLLIASSGTRTALADSSFNLPIDYDTSTNQWKLTADIVSTLDNGAILEARGDVILERGKDILKADFIRYYVATEWVYVEGDVFVKLGEDELTATEAEFDLVTSTGFLKNGNVFMSGPHIYFEGEHVNKYQGDTYSFVDAHITSCDPEDPVWGVRASSATVEIDGYATLSHANLVLAETDLPPLPYMVLPVKVTRQSGLLLPDYGYSSLHGTYYTQPYFWAIDEERDVTLYGSLFTKSGIMLSAEYRSHTRTNNKTWFGVDYLFSTFGSKEDDRVWLRGMSDGEILNSSWKYKLNADYVSDPSFLLDYDNNMTGYEETNESLEDFFGRGLSELDRNRITTGYVYNRWNWLEFALGFQYTQNPYYGKELKQSTDPTVQKLPEASVFVYPLASDILPIQFDAGMTGSYNYRRYGSSGAKTELTPRITIPFDLGFMTTMAQVGINHRNYFGGSTQGTVAPLEGDDRADINTSSTLLDMKFQASTELARVWEFGTASTEVLRDGSELLALRHILRPNLSYTYISHEDQTHLPYYSQEDRIYSRNELDLTLRNTFTAKSQYTAFNQEDNTSHTSIHYKNFAYIDLGFGYNFEEASRKTNLDRFERRPFKDVTLDANINAFGLGFNSKVSYSLYGDGITRFDLGTNVPLFELEKYLTWSVAYSYRDKMYDYQNILRFAESDDISLSRDVALLRNSFTIKPTSYLDFELVHYLDLHEKNSYEIDLKASYRHQCYVVSATYTHTHNEQRYGLSIVLPGVFE